MATYLWRLKLINILGISGKRESGKTSLANFLVEDYGFLRVSLANPLKEFCRKRWGLTQEQVYGKEKETPTKYRRTDGSYYTPRDILIREGCLARSIDPNYWCDQLKGYIDFMSSDTTVKNFVIDDIRFLNEVEYFSKLGAKFVRLERSQKAIGKAALDDLSECELDSYKDWDGLLLEEFNRDLSDLRRFASYVNERVVNYSLSEEL